ARPRARDEFMGPSNYNACVRRALCSALCAALCTAASARADSTDRLSRTIAFSPRKPVRVEATIADLTIIGSNRPDIAVEIVRRAPSAAALTKFTPVIDDSGDAIRIAAVQEADGRDAELRSEIVIRAPADAVFQAVRVFEGRVRVTGLTAACDVDL